MMEMWKTLKDQSEIIFPGLIFLMIEKLQIDWLFLICVLLAAVEVVINVARN